MINTFIIISLLFSIVCFLPAFSITHWSFRGFDFIRMQLLFLQILLFILGLFLFEENNIALLLSLVALFIAIIYQTSIILPYLPLKKVRHKQLDNAQTISIISVNVLQKNKEYEKLIKLIDDIQPDIVLTMETNKAWEEALGKIETDYPFTYKIPKENRYGMHFYTKLKVNSVKEHYFISDETPAIEVHLEDKTNSNFVFFGIHPPPPSPTEKPTSRQKDGELMKIAKLIRELKIPAIATGDFNNVCWSRSAKLFSKVSGMKDARLKNGIHGSFPAGPVIFRIPIDLIFSSNGIEVNKIKTLTDVGSDHLPIFSKFTVTGPQKEEVKDVKSDVKKEANAIIEEGYKAVEEEE
ncbi:endonuclease/exonuclease/phosphatase family protein [Dokdonia ponticola]|uniref:Endonuclease/exonuclease/phosphatase family protein n=1 Tax=Dokdonia ponticola TaxID=2041041 RepID=A0ABV9HWN5_9FLAO